MKKYMTLLCAILSCEAAVGAEPEAQPAQVPGDAPDQLLEITVTAQRREQNLQSTPVAVAAFNAGELTARGITDTSDLQQVVPNLVMYPQATSVTPFLRGIGTKNSVAGDENAVAVYVDGVYISSAAASIFELNNIAQIEVLKGPQGTLFGRNAAAGVIQVTTSTPGNAPVLNAEVGYGNYNSVESGLYASTPVTDTIATDLALMYRNQGDGFGRNIYNGREVFKGDDAAFRNKWVFKLSSSTTLTLSGDASYLVPTIPPLYRAADGATLVGGYRAPAHYYDVDVNDSEPGSNTQWGLSAHLDQDLSWSVARIISSYRKVDSVINFDPDGTPLPLQQARIDQRSKTFSQEFQLVSPTTSAIAWATGAYYWHDDTGVLPFYLDFKNSMSDRYASQSTNSYALYGQFTAPIASHTNVTAGARYTQDYRDIEGYSYPITTSGAGAVTPVVNATPSSEFNKVTWRVSLDHHFTDDVMGYIEDNRGFKSGVYNLFSPASAPVRPETLDTYEMGLKTELFDRRLRLNSDVFFNHFEDIQLQVPVAGEGTQLYNAASGKSYGVETDLDTAAFAGFSFSGGAAYLYSQYTNFPSAPLFAPAPGGGLIASIGSAKGNEFLIAPHWSGNFSVRYQIHTATGRYTANISDSYTGAFFFDVQNADRQSAYQLVNATLEWRPSSDHYGITLWAKNLNDAQYLVNQTPSAFGAVVTPGEPRTYGIRFDYKY